MYVIWGLGYSCCIGLTLRHVLSKATKESSNPIASVILLWLCVAWPVYWSLKLLASLFALCKKTINEKSKTN